jgi:hypothetical protein
LPWLLGIWLDREVPPHGAHGRLDEDPGAEALDAVADAVAAAGRVGAGDRVGLEDRLEEVGRGGVAEVGGVDVEVGVDGDLGEEGAQRVVVGDEGGGEGLEDLALLLVAREAVGEGEGWPSSSFQTLLTMLVAVR